MPRNPDAIPRVDVRDYWSDHGRRPKGAHAFINRCSLAAWDNFFNVDIRNADGVQTDYLRVPLNMDPVRVAADHGALYFVRG